MSDTVLTPPLRKRFSWPKRVFLFCVLFDMIFRSFSVLFPWQDWINELGMRRTPTRFLTRKEFAELRARGGDELSNDLNVSFKSLGEYVNPWPKRAIREQLTSWDTRSKYVLAWLASRLDLVENSLGINQEWPMFAPNVSRGDGFTRSRLLYEDGTERLVRQLTEPTDLTHYSHWNQEKILDHETKVTWSSSRIEECWGWCNLLSHRYRVNENGSPLKTILLYRVWIDYPPPRVEPRAFLLQQMELIRDHNAKNASRTFYTFDAATRNGEMERAKDD